MVNIVGKILDGTNLVVLAEPDPRKPTAMTVNETGEVDGTLTAGISPLSGSKVKFGPESYKFQSTATIGPSGVLNVGMFGGTHNDVANVTYSGTNDGEFALDLIGAGGSDQLSADVFMIPGSTGTVGTPTNNAIVKGSGKDRLRFTIEQGTDTTSTTNVFAQAIGTTRKDKIVHTANVSVKTKGAVSLVS